MEGGSGDMAEREKGAVSKKFFFGPLGLIFVYK